MLNNKKKQIKRMFLSTLKDPRVYGNVKSACSISGISRRTIYRYREEDKPFMIDWDNIVNEAKFHLTEEAAYSLLQQVRKGKTSAIIYVLKNLQPDKWKY